MHKSNVIDKNSFFIPSGYDRLSVLKSNDSQHDLDYEYSDQIKQEKEEDTIVEDVIKCEKLSDYLKKIKDRVYRSRKSMIREDIKMGKSLVSALARKSIETAPKEQKEKEETTTTSAAEKVNKFQKFLDKRESKFGVEEKGEAGKDEKLSKEERAKIARENLLNKLKLGKKDKK